MDARFEAMIQETGRQRNMFADLCINLRGEIAAKDAEIAKLKEQIADKVTSPPNVTKINALDTGSGS